MPAVTFATRYTGTRFRLVAEGLSAAARSIGEVYLERARAQAHKIRTIQEAGHQSPFSVPPHVRRWITSHVKLAIVAGGSRNVQRAIRDSAELLRNWLQQRLISGRLGRQSPVTRKIKLWLIDHGRISARYGRPPPLGIRSGDFLHSIRARVRRRDA